MPSAAEPPKLPPTQNSLGSKLLLVFLGLAVGLLLAEALIRVVPNTTVENMRRQQYMHDRNVVQFKYGEIDADPAIGYRYISNKRGIFENKEFRTSVRFNRFGFRGPDWSLSPDPHRRRMILLGDSFAFGWGVEENETFAELLNRARPDWQILNLGVSGFGTLQEWKFLQRYGPLLHPQDVIVAFNTGDPEADCYSVPHFPIQIQLPPAPKKHWSYLFAFVKDRLDKSPKYNYWEHVDPKALPCCEGYFGSIKNWCDEHHAQLHVIYIPVKDEMDAFVLAGYRKDMTEFWSRDGIDWLDVTPDLQHQPVPSAAYFQVDDHMTPKGHSVVAAALLKHLTAH